MITVSGWLDSFDLVFKLFFIKKKEREKKKEKITLQRVYSIFMANDNKELRPCCSTYPRDSSNQSPKQRFRKEEIRNQADFQEKRKRKEKPSPLIVEMIGRNCGPGAQRSIEKLGGRHENPRSGIGSSREDWSGRQHTRSRTYVCIDRIFMKIREERRMIRICRAIRPILAGGARCDLLGSLMTARRDNPRSLPRIYIYIYRWIDTPLWEPIPPIVSRGISRIFIFYRLAMRLSIVHERILVGM